LFEDKIACRTLKKATMHKIPSLKNAQLKNNEKVSMEKEDLI
jgi:hypothetical protein